MPLRDAIQRLTLHYPSYGWRRITAELVCRSDSSSTTADDMIWSSLRKGVSRVDYGYALV